MTEDILNIEDLRLNFYTYEGVVQALDGINLDLRKGETLGVVGETGCGKSVTGLSVLAIVPPPGRIEGGKVFFNLKGKPIDLLGQREAILRRVRGKFISMIFQDPRSALNPVYTAGDQISEVLLIHRRKELVRRALERVDEEIKSGKAGFLTRYYKAIYERALKNPRAASLQILSKIPIVRRYKRILNQEARKEAINMLRMMRIPDPERGVDMYPHELSGGMAQRVVIAIALACSPEILIADEPTTNLDVTVQLQILHLIKELKEKFASSVIYVTHDMGVIAEMCDRVAVMYAGNVVEVSGVLDIFKRPLHPYTQALLESIPRCGVPFKSIEGTVPSLVNPPKGCRFHDRCRYAMDVCTKVKPKMVEVEKEHLVQCFLYQ
jgi:peptide/nickel transport system ATP-binding protein